MGKSRNLLKEYISAPIRRYHLHKSRCTLAGIGSTQSFGHFESLITRSPIGTRLSALARRYLRVSVSIVLLLVLELAPEGPVLVSARSLAHPDSPARVLARRQPGGARPHGAHARVAHEPAVLLRLQPERSDA